MGVLVLLGVVGGLSLIGHNPALLVRNTWHDLRGDVVQVDGVSAAAVPETSLAVGTTAAAVVDGDPRTPWSTGWTAPVSPPACGKGGSGAVQLTLPATRIREIHIVSGVTDPSQRTLQLLPKTLHVTTSDGTCVAVDLTQVATVQVVPLDTNTPVTSVTITVAATYAPSDPRAKPVVSLSEVGLYTRPG